MKKALILTTLFLLSTVVAFSQEVVKVLIVDGQNNHGHWPKITYMLKKHLEDTDMFSVDVARSAYTWKGEEFLSEFTIESVGETTALEEPKPDSNFSPNFSAYDAVICNFGWNAAPWPEKTKKSFEKYMKKGGGLVVFHAADNSFPEWEAYNQMIGLGGWGDRTEKDGPLVYYTDEGELVRDTSPGKAGAHGPESEYQIQIRKPDHPITQGMPEVWMHTQDELYNSLRGPAENMEILATAYSAEDLKGTGRHEPALMTLTYGKGRVFHNIMGHADYSVACVGFLTTMLRGTEWAATGKVTQSIPADFPTADVSSSREALVKE
ncbi:ThuA domain-containing protein [Tunicatimonas pelagia]|uniref:ThuA domain-containing protein n=1 Tax=Tunicatimonas pelagia TaxID=931531 RepID=UPI002665AB03|nr:ThuA domain-containing protein [Tunicatimonas pelagia]WKN40632.1 ThuA domain-containing protein [Tunicatimonas pelagia]